MMQRKEPYIIQVKPGRRAFCFCGKSDFMPSCDGGHAGTGMGPMLVEFDEEKNVAICGCGQSRNLPFCDNSHSQLP